MTMPFMPCSIATHLWSVGMRRYYHTFEAAAQRCTQHNLGVSCSWQLAMGSAICEKTRVA
jgi:hypothetical protein